MPSTMETEAGKFGEDSPSTGAKVTAVVVHICNDKRLDEISPEYLKAVDDVVLSPLTFYCNITLRSGTVKLYWQTGVVVAVFKKVDQKVCSNCRAITLLSTPKKVFVGVLDRRAL